MAKVERLAQLSSLIKKREAISVKEMSRACGVSQRTIYRYLKTLSKLGAADQGMDGGVFSSNRDETWTALDAGDLDLIDFCLRHNSLTKYPFFMERLSKVRRKVREWRRQADREASYFALVEDEFDEARETRQNEVLERFTRAKLDLRKVAVTVRGSDNRPRAMIPVAVKISRAGVSLTVCERPGDDPTEIKLSDITRLVVSSEPFKPAAAGGSTKSRSSRTKTS